MTIFLTGATGHVGGATLRALINRTSSEDLLVYAGSRSPTEIESVTDDRIRPVAFDFGEPSSVRSELEATDRLFLMRPPALTDVDAYFRPLIELAAASEIERVVFLSLQGAERQPFLPHARIEKALDESPLTRTFLRPSFFMQNLVDQHLEEIRDRDELFVPAGRGRTNFIDARDIGAVAARSLLEETGASSAYELTGPRSYDYFEIAEVLTDVLDRPITYQNPSPIRFFARRVREGDPVGFTAVMTMLYTIVRLGWADRSTRTVEEVLGRSPVDFRTFAEDHREVWQP